MTSYQFKRRNFIAGVGAAVGLHTMLRNAEAQVQGTSAPKRLLVTHHPVGTCRYAYDVTGSGTTYTTSRILKPFEDAGLRNDMVIVDALNMDSLGGPGGGHERGTVNMMTAFRTYGTRTGQTETDDPMAAAPSMDQVIIMGSPEDLGSKPFKSLYALCDDRVDFQEISTRCLRYDVTQKSASVAINNFPSGTAPYENTPLTAKLKPLDLYTLVFGTMMPGGTGTTGGNTSGGTGGMSSACAALVKAFNAKKSVLDFSLSELKRLRTLAPASQRALLDAHEQAVRDLETRLQAQLGVNGCSSDGPDAGASTGSMGGDGGSGRKCMPPMAPSNTLTGGIDTGKDDDAYGRDSGTMDDAPNHRLVGEAHQAILVAAMQCDLTRVCLFQWSPGTNHISFKGLYPKNATQILQHHPTSHRINDPSQIVQSNNDAEFLVAAEIWYNQRHAEFMNRLKAAPDLADPAGGSLLDNTVVPYLTEVANTTHSHTNMPTLIFGGKSMGYKGGTYLNFNGRPWPDLWLTIAASFGVTSDVLKGLMINGKMGAPILSERNQGILAGVHT